MPASLGRQISFTWGGTNLTGVREKGLKVAGEPVDITSGENSGWRTLMDNISGQDEVSVSLSGVTKDRFLRQDWFSGTRTKTAVFVFANGDTISGTFFLASHNEGIPYNDALSFDAELVSSGPVTFTAGA
jgi:predicted secreted protein